MRTIRLLMAFILMLSSSAAFAQEETNTSTNQFAVTVVQGDIPGGGGGGGGGGGAGTAIGVAAGAGAAAAGAGAAALSPLFLPGLLVGAAASLEAPLCPVCLCDGKVIAELQACSEKYQYLLKAIAENCLHNPCNSKYVLVSDTCVMPGTYNVATFKIPKELAKNNIISVKLTQISDPYKTIKDRPEINSRIYINKSMADITKLYKNQRYWRVHKGSGEVDMDMLSNTEKAGILKKYGEINTTKNPEDTGILVTSYNMNGRKAHLPKGSKSTSKRYAVLLEFSNLDKAALVK